MRVMAFNGSPRKKGWNTVTMLENVLAGAAEAGAETELVQLYDLDFSGCISCFVCKKRSRTQVGVCAVQDDLTPVLARALAADALVVGTPVYWGCESAATRAFLERLWFPVLNYDDYAKPHRDRRIPTALVYTMNVPENLLPELGYEHLFARTRGPMERLFGPCELLLATDTMQYSDYDKFESGRWDKQAKVARHAEVFPQDCARARELGVRLVTGG